MTTAEAHRLASQNPVRALTTRLGELKEQADTQIANLTSTLKQIDDTRKLLDEHGLRMVVDLGEIGNAASQARRQMVSGAVRPTFQLPRQAA